ncbi:MAG: hypothetical protein JWO32_123 [Bacteroidetes bacterium]|nr:hypothetical protein [Bacteroidota bacterium]
MIKRIFIVLFIFCVGNLAAQTKKPVVKTKGKTEVAPKDTTAPDPELSPMEKLELTLPLENEIDPMTGKKVFYKDRKRIIDSFRTALIIELKKLSMNFYVKTKHARPKSTDKVQLCINIANKDTNLLYCVNDSICKDPEVSKVLFQESKGDTTYVLIYVDAFSKSKSDGGLCNAGKETKLFFARWNTKTNQAKWKQKTIASCIKGVTNMTKEPVADWNKSGILTVSYHRGSNFYDIKFDPQHPELGMQSGKDSEGK